MTDKLNLPALREAVACLKEWRLNPSARYAELIALAEQMERALPAIIDEFEARQHPEAGGHE